MDGLRTGTASCCRARSRAALSSARAAATVERVGEGSPSGRMSRTSWIPVLLVVTAFLPYLSKDRGIRVENLVTAILAVWAGIIFLYQGKIQRVLFPALGLSVVIFFHIVAATALNGAGMADLKLALGRIDHYSRPLAVLLVCGVCLAGASRDTVLRVFVACGKVLLVCVTLNAAVQVATVFTTVDWIVTSFRPAAGATGLTVADMAAGNFRFVGIFNQPLEHGAVYAVAIIVWVRLWQGRFLPSWAALTSLIAIVVGGVLGISKVFLLGGIPAAVFLFFARGVRARDVAILGAAVIALVLVFSGVAVAWRGSGSISMLLSTGLSPRSLFYIVFGGRFGGGQDYMLTSNLATDLWAIARQSPLFGVGAGQSFRVGDNEYLMGLVEGGILVLLLIVFRIVGFFVSAVRASLMNHNARALAALTGMVALGSMGGPISGIPRSGTVIWVFLTLLMLVLPSDPLPPPTAARPSG